MRLTLPVLCLALAPLPALAQAAASPQIMIDVKAGNFDAASELASQTGDPLMEKLVEYYQLLGGGGTPDDLQAFIAANPDWPQQGLLALRLAEASGAAPAEPAATPDFLTQAEGLHDAGNDPAAAALWISQGAAAAAAAPADAEALFWPDQDELARALLGAGDPKDAYAVVTAVAPPDDPAAHGQSAHGQAADRDFLAGFIALRFLRQPETAASWFSRLATASPAVITQARAWYWLGRSQSGAAAQADYGRAAAFPDTYYGQLAAITLGDSASALGARILAAGAPAYTADDALNFALMELPRAAALLVQMNDPADAQIFLSRLGQVGVDDRTRELAAKLATGLGYPQSAVAIARSAGIAGQMLIRDGWPMPYTPPATVEPALAYGIMRQESSFNPAAISGAGAQGLMQLMPDTARRTAAANGIPYHNDALNPTTNMALGTAYLAGLVQNFGNCLPLAIAAYNAGPTNVANWLGENGDPEMGKGPGGADIIDWVEEIPFAETRNYVQRVTESVVVYRALLNGSAESPLKPWLQS